jgi:hypothetical protein
VNVFSVADFERRFRVVDSATFAAGEWATVLVDPSSYRPADPAEYADADHITALLDRRAAVREAAAATRRPIAVWGAAGKGIVLAHALLEAGAAVLGAIDADPARQGLFMEVSGLPILSPEDGLRDLPAETAILVCNPNHLTAVRDHVGDARTVLLPDELPVLSGP